MGDHDHRDLLMDVQVYQNLHHYIGTASVEVTGGLVQQKDRGVIRDGSRDGDTLLLSSGQLVREMVETAAQAHLFKEGNCTLTNLIPRKFTSQLHGQLHVLKGCQGSNEVKSLKDEA